MFCLIKCESGSKLVSVEAMVLQAGDSVSAFWEGEEGEMWLKAVLKRVTPAAESLNDEIQYEVLFAKDSSGKRELRVVNKCQKTGQGLEVNVAQPRTPRKIPITNGINSNHGVSTVVQPKNGKDNKEDDETKALDIVTTCFDQLPDSSSRGRLMQALLRNVVGQSEFDKIRVGRAMVDSLQNFEERCKSDPRINYRTSELVLGAHTATLPSPELKLGREYERITLFDRHLHKKARSVIASKVEYHTETGLFAQKPRGLAKTTELRKSFITAFWRSRCSPRMLGSGSISKVI